jgi:solute:Na+ symporter, SSS family
MAPWFQESPAMSLNPIDLVVIVVYLAGMLLMGVYFSKRNTTTEEYFLGNRSFRGWVIGLSMVGTSISSLSFVGFPADAFKTGWLRMTVNLMLPVGLIAASYFFLPFYRRNKITSAYEYLERRFGPGVCVYGSLAYSLGMLMRLSCILFLVSVLVQSMIDISPMTNWFLSLFGVHLSPEHMPTANSIACILVAGFITAFYTIMGGITAVIWTDVIQTILLAGGALLCLAIVIYQVPGGLGEVFSMATANGKFGLSDFDPQTKTLVPTSWDLTLQTKTAAMMLFVGLNVWLREFSCMQTVIQRYSAAKSLHEGRKSLWVVACCSMPIWVFFYFLGTCLWVYYQHYPTQEATEMLQGTRKAEGILPFFIIHHLSPGVAGMVIAAAWAAAMSTLSSTINSMSQVTVNDIYRRHIVKGREDRHYLRVSIWASGVIGVLMVLGAIWFALADTATISDATTMLASVLGGGLLGLFMFGMLTTRGDSRAAICGILCAVVFVTWTVLPKQYLPGWLQVPFETYYTDSLSSLVMFGVGYLAALLVFRTQKKYPNLTIWTQDPTLSAD